METSYGFGLVVLGFAAIGLALILSQGKTDSNGNHDTAERIMGLSLYGISAGVVLILLGV